MIQMHIDISSWENHREIIYNWN